MSYNVASLPRGDDSIGQQLALLSEKPCSCDMCSFKVFKEQDKNDSPDLTMPYPSGLASPLSQGNIRTDAYLAPRTRHEQPYWYRPSYFGWRHVTSASHFTRQSSFLQLQNAPSTEFFELSRYHSTQYQAAGCPTTEYQTTGCHATKYNATEYHGTRYETTECHAPGYQDTESRATEYQDSGCHATGYQASASENRMARTVGGLAYDHGEFPKIISVHSMAESRYTVQRNSGDFNAIRSDSVETEPNIPNSLAGPTVPMTDVSFSNENSTLASSGYTFGSKICDNTEFHVNDDDNSSGCGSLCNSTNESKVVWNSRTENKSAYHSISTVLSPTSKASAYFSPSQNVGNTNPNEAFNLSGDYDLQNGQLSTTAQKSEVTDAENIKMPRCTSESSNATDGSLNSDTKTTFLTRDEENTSWAEKPELLVKLKERLILHRIQRISNMQTCLKHKDKSQRTQLLKKIAILKKEIEHLSNGSSDDENLSEVYMNIRERNPLNSAPVKMSPSAPNKVMVEGTKEVDREVSDQTTEVKSCSGDMNVKNNVGNSISSDKQDEKLSGNGFRMNVFEKLGLLHGNNQNTPRFSESANCSGNEQKSQTSQVKTSVKNVPELISKGNSKYYAPHYNLVYSEDTQEWKNSENGQTLVTSTTVTNAEDKLGYSSADSMDTLYPELPNSWSSAYVSENYSELNDGPEVLKRKHMDVNTLNVESAKRRCKTLPRKVVRKNALESTFDADVDLGEMPLQEGESKEILQKLESASSKTEERSGKEYGDCKLGTVGDSGNIGYDDSDTIMISVEGEDDTLQRNLELRESKICDLIRKQKGLLQTIEKMTTKHQPNEEFSLIP